MKQKLIQALPDRWFVSLKNWGWQGNFKSWKEAEQKTAGYNDSHILEKVKESLLKVKNGEALYERDSVLFEKIEYSWELLSVLMWIAAQNKGSLNIIDFGGSLGSTYCQNKQFLDELNSVHWNIVEQPNFVEEGKRSFENDSLQFYYSIEDCVKDFGSAIQGILFSSVLQYLENPFPVIKNAVERKIPYIIVDKTGFTLNDKTRLTIQKVHPNIYDASYPCWFFRESEFLRFFKENGYDLICDFKNSDTTNIKAIFKGFIFKYKEQ
jgi:hypothetical protein